MAHHCENENYFTETKAVINQILNILIMITLYIRDVKMCILCFKNYYIFPVLIPEPN